MQSVNQRKKSFNFRLPAALAIAFAVGIVYGVALAYLGIDGVYIAVPVAVALIACAVCTAVYKRASLSLCIALTIIFFTVAAIYVYAIYFSFCATEVPLNQTCAITGVVDKVGVTASGRNYLVISSATAGGERLNGKIIAHLGDSAGDYCEAGYSVKFLASLQKESFFESGALGYGAENGVKYYCTIYGGLDSAWKFSLFGAVNGAFRGALFNNLDGETAAVCFALLTGDSSLISAGTLASFRYGGIAHLFAVSGLHIGIIFGAITLLFKKLPVNRYVSAVARIAVVFFYAGVCGFSPSSVRAAVMCAVSVCAALTYKKYDALNALSLSALILLLINPLYLFGAGFLLSFGAVLGIIMLSRNVDKLLGFLPKKLRGLLTVGVSSQLTTLPTQLACFGYVSWAGLLLNLIVVPIISLLYVIMLVCVIFAAIVPVSAAFIVPFATMPVQLTVNLIVECGFENAIIEQSFGQWIYLPVALAVVGVSDKFNLRLFWRSALVTIAFIWLALGFFTADALFASCSQCGAVKEYENQ